MRHTAALLIALVLNLRLDAQLPAGASAPDFTATDLAGQSWHLYDLLDEGKIVVLGFGATWCPPCWAYHQGKALEDFYSAHGPAGDDRARVFFVEADPATPPDCLQGPASCATFTPGNWLNGNTYPFLDNSTVAADYEAVYLPQVYVVCPNRKAYAVGTLSAGELWDFAQGCPVAFGVHNAGLFHGEYGSPFYEVCDSLPITPTLQLINLGTAPLIEAQVQLRWNGQPLQTLPWNGYLPLYGETTLAFDALSLPGAGALQASLISVNTLTDGDDDPANDDYTVNFAAASQTASSKVVLRLRTDEYGAETYWEIRDEQGMVLEAGGNMAVGPGGGGTFPGGISGGPGAYGNLTVIRDTIELPAEGCYSLHLVDAFGDGICCQYGAGFYRLYGIDDAINPVLSGGAFDAYEERRFRIGLGAANAGEAVNDLPTVEVYPNPAYDRLRVELAGSVADEVVLFNIFGQAIQRKYGPSEHFDFSLAELPAGTYWLLLRQGQQRLARVVLIER